MEQKHVFISYKSDEKNSALETKFYLEEHGISCWMDETDIFLGENYANVIANAIENSFAVVIILSRKSANSKHVQSEIRLAGEYSIPVLAFAIENFDPFEEFNFSLPLEERYDAFENKENAYGQLYERLLIISDTTSHDPYDVRKFFKSRQKYRKKQKLNKEEPSFSKKTKQYIKETLGIKKNKVPAEKKLYHDFPLNLTPYSKPYSQNVNVRLSLNTLTAFALICTIMVFLISFGFLMTILPAMHILSLPIGALIAFFFFVLIENISGVFCQLAGKIKNKFLVFIASALIGFCYIYTTSKFLRIIIALFVYFKGGYPY